MDRVQLGDIYYDYFVFREYDPDTIILHRIDEIKFTKKDNKVNGNNLHYFIKDYYLSLWKKAGIFLENVSFSSKRIDPGSFVQLHTDMASSQYKAIVFCPQNDYDGALFTYGIRGEELKFKKLKFGDIVFCKTGDDRVVHGFTKLVSNEPIVYLEIYGNLSRKNNVKDKYYSDLDIEKLEH